MQEEVDVCECVRESEDETKDNQGEGRCHDTSCALTNMSRPLARTERRMGSRESGFRISTEQ